MPTMPGTDGEIALSLRDVAKTFRTPTGSRYTALEHLDLEVPAGRFVTVVGPSGCGKSTTLSLASGLTGATSGMVRLLGRPVSEVRTDVGFIFQRDALLPWKTVHDNVALPLMFRSFPKEEIDRRVPAWLARVGLRDFAHHYPHQLSGGMRKRVQLAQSLVYDPPVLLMDEPFSALDVLTRNLMENELLELWQSGTPKKSVLFITHDLEEAIALSDEIVVMTAGPGRVKARYTVDLPRPRNVTEIRFAPAFVALYERAWNDLRDEVMRSYERSLRAS